MILVVEGHHLPGRACGGHADVHVGIQVGSRPTDLVPADRTAVRWEVPVEVVGVAGVPGVDFRGPAVHGRRGSRFVYLTWGEGSGEDFAMFRRAKLVLDDVPDPSAPEVVARVHLTDGHGLPRCARLRPPALEWVGR